MHPIGVFLVALFSASLIDEFFGLFIWINQQGFRRIWNIWRRS